MPSAWDQTPEDLRALGYERDAAHLFGRLQRIATWDAAGPALGRRGRDLVERAGLDLTLPRIVEERPSADGATRIVLELADGARIEAVHMPRAVRRPRVTICVSSQVGCAMGCTFCATARMGLVRSLTPAEVVAQLHAVMRRFGPRSVEQLNVVFMGMGEPLHDVEVLVRALEVLCDPAGLGLAPGRVTVSTVGHVANLDRLAESRWLPQLAISVNAASDEVRRSLMPINRKWPLAELRAALDRWPRDRKVTLEYVLLAGVNDDDASADRLARWVGDLRHVVNVIPFNAWEGAPYREPSEERIAAFCARLHAGGCLAKVRRSRGRDARAACGMLVTGRAATPAA
ncbi:MAG: 23S rRNA (adenine(2503)-C(2))-methyltransferase RlmN [Labilithrix sp.]|nr:23S rRNA (adenine(2503)-C(2))-methyltransferase RlmN [Labilithrix sp.]MCW5815842.1 23S rRNA (adenine(2503)-C(2))-methyltransferase RlmN [Labilithrix sp.]